MTALPSQDSTLAAFGIALGMHLAVFLLLPYLEHMPSPPPLRVEIDLTQAPSIQPEAPSPQPTPPQPEPPKPVTRPQVVKTPPHPQQQALPILATHDETQPTPQDYVVPDIPAAATPVPVTPSAPVADATAESAPVSSTETASTSANTQATQSNEADPTAAWDGYGRMLYDMVSKNKTYPQIAIRRHLQGQAKVSARFEMGRLAALTLLEPGSGHAVLDSAAMEMLKKAVNALPIKGDLARKSFTVVVPVDFRIEG